MRARYFVEWMEKNSAGQPMSKMGVFSASSTQAVVNRILAGYGNIMMDKPIEVYQLPQPIRYRITAVEEA